MSWHHFLLLLLLATLSAAANLKIRIGPDQSDPTRQDESDFNINGISLTATTRALLTRIQRQENLPSESFELYTLKGRKLLSELTLLEQTIKQNDVLRLVPRPQQPHSSAEATTTTTTTAMTANLKIRIGPDQSDPTRQDESDININGISLTAKNSYQALFTRIQRQENLPSESFELYTLEGRKLLSGLTLIKQAIKQNDVLRLVVLQATVYKFISNTFVQGQHKGQLWHIVEKPLHNPTTTQQFQRRLVPSSLVFDELYPNVLWSDVSIIPDHELELLEIGPPELSRNMESSTTFQILAGPTPIRRDLGVPCHSPFGYGVMSAVSFW